MVTPESLYISRLTQTIPLIQYSIYFKKLFTSMDFHPGLDLTKEVKTLEFPCFLNWRACFSEGYPQGWKVTLIVKEIVHVLIDYFPLGKTIDIPCLGWQYFLDVSPSQCLFATA